MRHLDVPARAAATPPGHPARPRAALPALCLTQITGWGIVYYAFPVLNPEITAATGWSPAATTAAFSLALLVSAAAGIRIGRVLDARGPRTVMTAGSVLGTLSLVVVATAPNVPVFTVGWLLAGLAMAATFYQPAFAALTRWWAPDHVRALTVVTLAAVLAAVTVPALARGVPPAARAALLIGLGGATTAAFALLGGPYPLLAVLAVVAGAVRGNLTLLQATAVTDRWGTAHYGRLSALLAAPATTASALAPFAGTALAGPLGGYPALFAVLALVSVTAALFAHRTAVPHRSHP